MTRAKQFPMFATSASMAQPLMTDDVCDERVVVCRRDRVDGRGHELNPLYFDDAVAYHNALDEQRQTPTLFDALAIEGAT